ncbi:MAG: hypothetical protein ACRELW_23945 [Candidatus Rokuibacteriota bacterium]
MQLAGTDRMSGVLIAKRVAWKQFAARAGNRARHDLDSFLASFAEDAMFRSRPPGPSGRGAGAREALTR